MFVQPFTLVWPTMGSDVPEAVAGLIEREGVPLSILAKMYSASPQVEMLPAGVGDDPAAAPLASFATMSMVGAACIDCRTHEVVWKPGVRVARRTRVNATLNQFNRSVRAFLDRWPFYHLPVDDEDDDGQAELVADELEATLSAIDPTTMEFQSYWAEIVSEVRCGAFSVEEVLGYG